jgi:hypothetical protein
MSLCPPFPARERRRLERNLKKDSFACDTAGSGGTTRPTKQIEA